MKTTAKLNRQLNLDNDLEIFYPTKALFGKLLSSNFTPTEQAGMFETNLPLISTNAFTRASQTIHDIN